MRKTRTLVALCALALAIPATAFAANEYSITASTNPTKSGTARSPKPISTRLAFTVRDSDGNRPKSLEELTIALRGMAMNTNFFPGCSATRITQAQNDNVCPNGSLVATGFARNITGNRNDFSDQSQRCYLELRLHNARNNRLALFVRGSNAAGPGAPTYCALNIATAIPVSVTSSRTQVSFSLTIPESLKHPLASLTNSIVEMGLRVTRKTVRRGGKTRGFLETRGGCVNGRRTITMTFENEQNNDVRQSTRARCSK